MTKRQKRILLALGWYDYRLHEGIARYAVEHGWHLCPDSTKEKVIPWGWDGDGILAWLGAGDDLAEFVAHARKPTVDFSLRRPQLLFPRVLVDHVGAAKLAVEHFLALELPLHPSHGESGRAMPAGPGAGLSRFLQRLDKRPSVLFKRPILLVAVIKE
jgi:LacI family transcriptional regulator